MSQNSTNPTNGRTANQPPNQPQYITMMRPPPGMMKVLGVRPEGLVIGFPGNMLVDPESLRGMDLSSLPPISHEQLEQMGPIFEPDGTQLIG